ncbi:Coiled-coil domain-containing protein 43 [Gryllus bimaculatus]|nr:Coiled-coil domain-containing protein 43 [Gryllus bimaculatus]
MAVGGEDFDSWLSVKLKALNTDEGVFGSYIKGILAGEEETVEDKTEALEGILSEITENDIPAHCREIMDKWQNVGQGQAHSKESAEVVEDVDVKLARLLESQARPTTVQRTYTEEERRIREAILAQYSQRREPWGERHGTGTRRARPCVLKAGRRPHPDRRKSLKDRKDGTRLPPIHHAGSGATCSRAGQIQLQHMSDQEEEEPAEGESKEKESGLARNTNAAVVAQAEKEKREKAKLESQRKKEKDKEDREKQKQMQQEKKEKRRTQKGERRR